MPVKTSVFNKENDIIQYIISNSKETLIVKVLNYGAIISNILFNDNNNKQRDLVLGYDDYEGYTRNDNPYFGALVGRYGNRIANGSFTLNDTKYQLAINLEPNTLHGGIKGFDKKKWDLKAQTENSITLDMVSIDGEEHFPGTIKVSITYTVTEDNELQLEYSAELLDMKDTIINLTNHSYFNLNGCTNKEEVTVLNHMVSMTASNYLEVDETLVPSGKIISTKGSALMDFAEKQQTLSDRIPTKIDGYDHCYVIDTNENDYNIKGNKEVRVAAIVRSPITGISLTFSTTEPGFQFYTGNVVSDLFNAKTTQSVTALKLAKYSGFCLEAQRFPDAINQEKFKKQVILSPTEKYQQKTIYKFSNK